MVRRVAKPGILPNPANWPDTGVHAAWVGHSTVLLKVDGFTILTDPVLSTRAGLTFGKINIGIKRLVEPSLQIHNLPHIDLILLSHAHMDHFDIPTLRALESKATRIVTAKHTSGLLRQRRYHSVQELNWNESAQIGEARVTGLEVNHWGARFRTDTFRGYNGYLVQVQKHQIMFAGDTANTDAFRRLPGNGKPQLAIFPIGAYNPWITRHCNPEQAWRMANEARAEFLLPVHHQTFTLGREPLPEPIDRLMNAAGRSPQRIGWQEIGATFAI